MVSFTLQRFGGARGFLKMGSDHAVLRRVPGVRFYRLLGTGRGADLTLGGDLGRWARFVVWSDAAALARFEASPWRRAELARAEESCTLVLRPLRWNGRWGGRDPLAVFAPVEGHAGPLAVLTRGTIRPSRLRAFWGAVPSSQGGLHENPGLLASVGVGEVPLLFQGTFSLWRDAASVKAFAYRQPGHVEAIRRTHREGWYSEELFARFAVLGSSGTWDGRDPLEGIA